MLKHLIPRIPLSDLPALLGFTVLGAAIAGCYGVLHDRITFAIGPEYFYNFKFHQFSNANPGLGDRVFAGCIGFLTTWWVGLIVGWILARRCLSSQNRKTARRQICYGFIIVFTTGFGAGLSAYLYGLWRGPDADYSDWASALAAHNVTDTWGFMRVAYIHNASYIGGAFGLALTYVMIRPAVPEPETSDGESTSPQEVS